MCLINWRASFGCYARNERSFFKATLLLMSEAESICRSIIRVATLHIGFVADCVDGR